MMAELTLKALLRAKAALEANDKQFMGAPGTRENPLLVYEAEYQRLKAAGYDGYMKIIGMLPKDTPNDG